MSGWTVMTVQGRESEDYEHSEHDDYDRWDAVSDIVATMEEDSRIFLWTVWKDYVYAYIQSRRYDFDTAERILMDYSEMVDTAVVLGANNTTDTGIARYYPNPEEEHADEYEESQGEDGTHVGEIALSHMNARHGIVARDPFHNNSGQIDGAYLNSGENIL